MQTHYNTQAPAEQGIRYFPQELPKPKYRIEIELPGVHRTADVHAPGRTIDEIPLPKKMPLMEPTYTH